MVVCAVCALDPEVDRATRRSVCANGSVLFRAADDGADDDTRNHHNDDGATAGAATRGTAIASILFYFFLFFIFAFDNWTRFAILVFF